MSDDSIYMDPQTYLNSLSVERREEVETRRRIMEQVAALKFDGEVPDFDVADILNQSRLEAD